MELKVGFAKSIAQFEILLTRLEGKMQSLTSIETELFEHAREINVVYCVSQ